MDKSSFLQSLESDIVPIPLSLYAMALWYDAKGNWMKAHDIIQNIDDARAYRIHAYLHRKEGDIPNAKYWYMRANTIAPSTPLDEEWEYLLEDSI